MGQTANLEIIIDILVLEIVTIPAYQCSEKPRFDIGCPEPLDCFLAHLPKLSTRCNVVDELV